MKKERMSDGVRGRIMAAAGALAIGLSPVQATAGKRPPIDREQPERVETATFALG